MRKSELWERRALSLRGEFWQSRGGPDSTRGMTRAIILAAALLAAPAYAGPGEIDVLPAGRFVCELPGDAAGPVGRRIPDSDFTIVNASSYRSKGVIGSYLLTGDALLMTNGPLRGRRFLRINDNFLRQETASGDKLEALRCVRQKRNNR